VNYDDCNAAGGMTAYNWEADPRRLAFQFARYKFVAKMLEGRLRVLELGCADGQGAKIVRQHVSSLDAVDIDPAAIGHARRLASTRWTINYFCADVLATDFRGYDAVYALDLFEHMPDEAGLLARMSAAAPVAIIGTPSAQSQLFASEISRREHVNCVDKAGLRRRMEEHWTHVFAFGMNDETLHTGFDPMCHYLLAIGCR